MCPKEKWDEIRGEYVTTDIAQRPLADKHGVSFNTLKCRANREKWAEQREEYRNTVAAKTQQKLEELAEQQAKAIVGTCEWVKQSLIEVARRCMEPERVMVREGRDVVPATDDNGNAVFTFNANGANRALELLGKENGMFVDKQKTELDGALKIVIEYADSQTPAPKTAPSTAENNS